MSFASVVSTLLGRQRENEDESTIQHIEHKKNKNPYEVAVSNRERTRRAICEYNDKHEWEDLRSKLKAAKVSTNLGAAIVMHSIFLGDVNQKKHDVKAKQQVLL